MENNENNIGREISDGARKVEELQTDNEELKMKRLAEQERAQTRIREAKLKAEEKKREKSEKEQRILQKKKAKLEQKRERQKSGQNKVSGWLAAVVALSVSTLSLTAVVTYGAINLKNLNAEKRIAYESDFYEIVSTVDELNNDFMKLDVATSEKLQAEILTDVYLKSRLLESGIGRFPVETGGNEQTANYVNFTAETSKRLMEKLARGESLTERDKEMLTSLYKTNQTVREELDTLAYEMTDADMEDYLKKVEKNKLGQSIKNVENASIALASESPFERNKDEQGDVKAGEEIPSSKAEELVRTYFEEYDVDTIDFVGETTSYELRTFNYNLTTRDGEELFVEIARKGGELVAFNSFKECEEKVMDMDNARLIAEKFLEKLGYDGMQAVWESEFGTNATFDFAYVLDDTVFYTDLVRVKVCEARGKVIGLDARIYLKNQDAVEAVQPRIDEETARKSVSDKLSLTRSNLTVLPKGHGKDVVAYEFVGEYDGREYYVYVNAQTGEEEAIYVVENSMQGTSLK